MKPWRTDPAAPSDFARSDAAAARPHDAPEPSATALRCGAAVGAATLALGFAEACLLVEHRPIPLPFAARFALYNAVPSAVWSSIAPQHIAAVANLPLDRLVAEPATVHGDPNLLQPARRFVAIHTLRSLRYAVASYGLLWSAWRWHEARSQLQFAERGVAPEDSARVRAAPAGRVERVVRLAPAGSSLCRATRTKHGDHVRHVPWRAVHRGDAIDWSTVGLEEARRVTGVSSAIDADGNESSPPLKVLELEVDGDHEGALVFLLAKRAAAGANGSVRTIAVVDAAATPDWHARSNGVDVYYYALSGIVEFLREHLSLEGDNMDNEVVLIAAENDEQESKSKLDEKALLQIVRRTLIHRHGISTSIGMKHALVDDHEDDAEDGDEELRMAQVVTAVFSPSVDAAAKQIDKIAGLVPLERTLVVVDESIRSQSTLPKVISKCAGVMSVADLTDTVLQRIREQLRAGATPETIQLSIFEDFGEQSALLRRADAASEITKYI